MLAAAANRREADADPAGHAEIVAIALRAAAARPAWRLAGCTLVVTLEPCMMCAGAIAAARIDRLVYGAADPQGGRRGVGMGPAGRPAARAGGEVIGGVLAAECGAAQRLLRGQRRGAGWATAVAAPGQTGFG